MSIRQLVGEKCGTSFRKFVKIDSLSEEERKAAIKLNGRTLFSVTC